MTEEIRDRLALIYARLDKGKVEQALAYRNDVEFLLDLIDKQQSFIKKISSLPRNDTAYESLVEIMKILSKYGFRTTGPTA